MRSASVVFSIALLMMASVAAWSQALMPYTQADLDQLLGPIALYPDPLLAQVLPAATFPDQLEAAQQMVGYQGGSAMIDDQYWDVSVKAVAHYPDVLNMMATSPDWTIAVGQAYVNQPDAVMRSIQRLRGRARLMGYLSSNSYQTVATSGGYISIVPAQAQYIYVPTYDPGVVYVQRRPSYASSIFAFGAGLLIGAWLNNAIDWNHHRVYYHGWNGGGWIGRSRPRVQLNNSYYVNSAWRNRSAPINRDVRSRDITNYRQQIKRGSGKYTPPQLVLPARRSTPTIKPTTPRTRPVRPTTRPAMPITPGLTPTRPATPGTGPFRPSTRPSRIVPGTVKPAVPSAPSTRSNKRPSAVTPRSVTPAVPSASSTRSNRRPSVVAPRPATRTTPNVPTVRSNPRPSAGVSRPTPSTRQSTPRTSGKQKAGKDKKTRGGGN